MAPLPKGPYTLKIDYAAVFLSVALTHTVEVNCSALGSPAIGSLPTAVNLGTRSGGSVALNVAANDFWNVFRQGMPNTTTATIATLYRYDGPGAGDVFITAVALTNTVGSGGGIQPGHETILTLRTGVGRVMKLAYLEDVGNLKTRQALTVNALGSAYQRMAAYLMSGSSFVHGRGGAFPIATMNESQSYNEATEQARYRPNA